MKVNHVHCGMVTDCRIYIIPKSRDGESWTTKQRSSYSEDGISG